MNVQLRPAAAAGGAGRVPRLLIAAGANFVAQQQSLTERAGCEPIAPVSAHRCSTLVG